MKQRLKLARPGWPDSQSAQLSYTFYTSEGIRSGHCNIAKYPLRVTLTVYKFHSPYYITHLNITTHDFVHETVNHIYTSVFIRQKQRTGKYRATTDT